MKFGRSRELWDSAVRCTFVLNRISPRKTRRLALNCGRWFRNPGGRLSSPFLKKEWTLNKQKASGIVPLSRYAKVLRLFFWNFVGYRTKHECKELCYSFPKGAVFIGMLSFISWNITQLKKRAVWGNFSFKEQKANCVLVLQVTHSVVADIKLETTMGGLFFFHTLSWCSDFAWKYWPQKLY